MSNPWQNYGGTIERTAPAMPSRWVSAIGAFAISYVVGLVTGFLVGMVLGGAWVVDATKGDGVDDSQLAAGFVAVLLITAGAATLSAVFWLSGRKVGNPFVSALVGTVAGTVAGVVLPATVDELAGLGLVLSAVVQVVVTAALIKPAAPRERSVPGASFPY